MSDMRLAGICKGCMKRLGVDERLTVPLQVVQMSKLETYDAKQMAGIQYPSGALGGRGTTKITYKIAKTVKETIDDGASSTSHPGSHH